MNRRDFLVASAAVGALSALPVTARAASSSLWPRQALLRDLARDPELQMMLVCWGHRSGKSQLARAVCQDRIEALQRKLPADGADIFIVSHSSAQAKHLVLDLEPADGVRTHHLDILGYVSRMRNGNVPVNLDSVFFDEVDWMDVPPPPFPLWNSWTPLETILWHSSPIPRTFKYFCSSPRSEKSSFLFHIEQFQKHPHRAALVDHAATWEVNPLISHGDLLRDRAMFPAAWDRDFAAYREPYHEARIHNSI